MNLFRKSILKKKTKRFKHVFRVDGDFIWLALIQDQIGIWIDPEAPVADVIQRLASRKRFYRETADALPMMPRRVSVNDETEFAQRVWRAGVACAKQSWSQDDGHIVGYSAFKGRPLSRRHTSLTALCSGEEPREKIDRRFRHSDTEEDSSKHALVPAFAEA